MSNENREYPAWLDEELFAGLAEESAPPAADSSPNEAAPVPQETVPVPQKAAPAKEEKSSPSKKKKAKKAAAAEEKSSGKKPGKKKDTGKAEEAPEKKPEADPETNTEEEKDEQPSEAPDKAPADDTGRKKKKDKKDAAPPAQETAEREPAGREKKGKKRSAARKWLIAMIVLVSFALIICVGALVAAYMITNSETNLPNVYVGGVYVGGLTKEQTIAALDEAKWDETRGGTLTATLPEGVGFELDYLTAGAYQPKEEAAEAAFAYGHTEDMFENLFNYVRGIVEPVDLARTEFTIDRDYVAAAVNEAVDEFEERTAGEKYTINEKDSTLEFIKGVGELTLDRETIIDNICALFLKGEHELNWDEIAGEPTMPDFGAVAEELKREPENAYYDPEKDEIIPEIVGVELDTEQVEKLWKDAGVLEKVVVPITLIEPEITAEGLQSVLFHDKLGDCLTYLWGSTANRISNVRLACSRFDGMVLQPGERFSYNDVVGERTAEAGFKIAPTYSGTAHLDALGGGICQVSSTLYNAVQYANLEVNERVCHTMLVGYLDPGLDATVDWPDTNFVFTNNREYPIRLKAWVDDSGRSLTIEIWGTDVDGSYVDIIHGSYPAYDETYRAEYGLDVQIGTGAWNFRRVTYPDGTVTEGPKVYSYYHLPEEDIKWPVIESDDYEESEEG